MIKGQFKKIARFTVRWGIAVVGIWWVISQMSIMDHGLIVGPDNRPVKVQITAELPKDEYRVKLPSGEKTEVNLGQFVNAPDRKKVTLKDDGKPHDAYLLALDLSGEGERRPVVNRLLVADKADGPGRWISPDQVQGGFILKAPHPKIEVGVMTMAYGANPWLLVLAVMVMPVTIACTSIRWHELLKAIDIRLPLWQTTVLNMVGMFYNTFIPTGSTGGDVLKAYYAAQHTTHKARAVVSVFVDRVIGLVVLIMMGGTMAGVYLLMANGHNDPATQACKWVAGMALLIVTGLGLFLAIMFHPRVRALLWSEKVLARLPMRKHIESAFEVMGMYRRHPGLMIWAVLITVPVHATVVVSAMLAGKAFGLPLSWGYYWIVVPVTVLASAVPISPQGAGIMEVVAIGLTARQGATISQAFALTMAIRVVQILWNLVGGIFVVTGHYRAPDAGTEAQTLAASPG